MLTAGARLALRSRRRRWLKPMAALSLGLHLAILSLALALVRLPELSSELPAVEIAVDAAPAETQPAPGPAMPSEAVPAAAVPTNAVPPEPAPPPAPAAPPPEAQAPPPPPPDQTQVAAAEPPPPAPPPPPTEEEPPAPRRVVRPPPRRSPAPARTTIAQAPPEPSAGAASAAVAAAPAAESPDSFVQVAGGVLGPDWIRQLQAWWNRHAFFPGEAVLRNVSGIVKVHLVVQPDGTVSTIHVLQSSGSKILDNAAYVAFRGAHLHPFPPGTPAPQADVTVTLHYVLTSGGAEAAALAKRPFTVTNVPAPGAILATTQQKTCTGVLVLDSAGELDSWRGRREWAQATFYRTPDGQPRVRFSTSSDSVDVPVNASDGSAGWMGKMEKFIGAEYRQKRYAIWPAGPDHVSGSVVDTNNVMADGTIDLSCNRGTSEQSQR